MSDKPNYCVTAFPGFFETEGRGPVKRNSDGEWEFYTNGKTLLDYFAGQALAGLLANPGGPVQSNPMSGTGYCNGTVESTAAWAFDIASAMLEARKAYL